MSAIDMLNGEPKYGQEPMYGRSIEADFEGETWTFQMTRRRWEVTSGFYAIVSNDDWQEMSEEYKALKSDMAHQLETASELTNELELARRLLRQVDAVSANLHPELREKIARFFDPKPIA